MAQFASRTREFYNKAHDAKGRFASSSGSGIGGIPANPRDWLSLGTNSTAKKRGSLENARVVRFRIKGTLEGRAADVEGINAIIRDGKPGTVVMTQRGVTVSKVASEGMRAFVLHDAAGRAVMDFPAGAPMVAAAYAVSLHHLNPGKAAKSSGGQIVKRQRAAARANARVLRHGSGMPD